MKEKTAQLDGFDGIRNDVDVERLSARDLASGSNIDLDNTGKPSLRRGGSRRVSGAPRSLWSSGPYGYFLDGTSFKMFAPPSTVTTLRTGLSAYNAMAYTELNGAVYYTNSEITGRVVDGASRPWGTPVPVLPAATIVSGNLRAGRYGVTATYKRRNGQESGARYMQQVVVEDGDGFSLALSASTDPDVESIRVYVTGRNGELPFFVGEVPSDQATFVYTDDAPGSVPIATMFKGPPLPGHLSCSFNGRILIARGRYLWYTDPYSPELVDLRKGYLPLDDRPTILAPASAGVYVATRSRTVFLRGSSPESFVVQPVAPYGAPRGNFVEVDGGVVTKDGIAGPCVAWLSARGLVVGDGDGRIVNLSQKRYVLPDVDRAATVFKQRGGLNQFVSVLFT